LLESLAVSLEKMRPALEHGRQVCCIKIKFELLLNHRFISKKQIRLMLILFALITGNSSLEPLPEGRLAQIHVDLSSRGFGQNRIGDLRITHIEMLCKFDSTEHT